MSVPAPLTWTALLPADSQFIASPNVPAWFSALLARKPGARRISVYSCEDISRLRDDAFVAINCRGAARLDPRYKYVRRFAVLPSLENARWFVPLESPALSAAAFSLYSPAKFSARMKVRAAKLAAHTRLPLWYRDQILVAQTEAPPLQRQAELIFPNQDIYIALSAGAPEPARNRKTSAAILTGSGQILGFAKIAGSTLSERLVRQEAQLLTELQKLNTPIAPRGAFSGEIDGSFVLMQDVLPGRVTSAHFTDLHRELLETMQHGRRQRASDCQMMTRLQRDVRQRPELVERLHSILPILSETSVPSTVVHGDFAPWNLREDRGALCAFDWEYGELDGLPFIDEIHFRLQVGHEMRAWSPGDAADFLLEHARRKPLALSSRQVQAIQQVALIDQLARLFGEGYDRSNEMLTWYEELLGLITPLTKEAVLA
jgi:hypothetical protein